MPRTARGELTWRALREEDLACVAALEAEIHAAPWTLGNFRDALVAGYATHVGERDGRIVAYGVLMPGPGEAQILNLSVVAGCRREGMGRQLLQRLIDNARRLGAEQVFLEVRISNTAAIALYHAEGFGEVARRGGYYPPTRPGGVREDALVMRRALTPATDAQTAGPS